MMKWKWELKFIMLVRSVMGSMDKTFRKILNKYVLRTGK